MQLLTNPSLWTLLTLLTFALLTTARPIPARTTLTSPRQMTYARALEARIALATDDSETVPSSKIVAAQKEAAAALRLSKREPQQRNMGNKSSPKPKGPGKHCLTVRGKVGLNGEDCVEMLSW